MFKHLTSVVVAVFLLAAPAFSFGVSQHVIDAVRPITFKGQNICTATKINDAKDLWLTANHCVPPPDYTGPMIQIDGITAIIVARSAPKDMAVLFVPGGLGSALNMQDHPVEVGQPIKVWGHPIGLPVPQLFQGFVSSLNTPLDNHDDEGNVTSTDHYTLFNLQVCGGNSGSAVLNEADEVVSVVQIGFGHGCTGFSGGAMWDELKEFAGKFFGNHV